jgi:hypothetical protein
VVFLFAYSFLQWNGNVFAMLLRRICCITVAKEKTNMTKLLGLRTVYDIDPTKTFRVADILEAGAILPRSVRIDELMVADLAPEKCVCFEFMGDNPECPIHGELDGSDNRMSTQMRENLDY